MEFRLIVFLICSLFVHCAKKDSKDIFFDDFNRADGDLGGDYTKYIPANSGITISGGRVYPTYTAVATGAHAAALYNQKITVSHSITAKFQISGGTFNPGIGYIIGRSQAVDSLDNMYLCGYNSNALILYRVVNTTTTVLGTTNLYNLVTGNSEAITLTFDQSTIKCAVWAGSNNASITFVDGTFSQGYAGVTGGGTGGVNNYLYIDDLDINKL